MISGIVLVIVVGWVVTTDAHLLSSDGQVVPLGLMMKDSSRLQVTITTPGKKRKTMSLIKTAPQGYL